MSNDCLGDTAEKNGVWLWVWLVASRCCLDLPIFFFLGIHPSEVPFVCPSKL